VALYIYTLNALKHYPCQVMKLLIYGANGWIGKQFTNYLDQQHTSYVKSQQRMDDIAAVREELNSGGYTHILSLIGRTTGVYQGNPINTIDYLEKPGGLTLNVRDNLFAPISLALLCKELGIHFTYFGTGCIFNYDREHTLGSIFNYSDREHVFSPNGWTEEDQPNFFGSSYSIVKGYTDRLMHMFENVLNLRIRMPITKENHPRNFITKITKYEKICSIPNSMTVLHTFFPAILDMMNKGVSGTFNCTNPGVISHNQILELYKELVDPQFTWSNFTIQEQDKILASKRSNNFLDTTKLTQLYNIPDIHTAVRETLLTYHV